MPAPRPRATGRRAAAGAVVAVVALAVVAVLVVPGWWRDDDATGARRGDEVRAAARRAGLSAEVADVLALAARGTTATFQVTYQGTGGATLVVTQAPPNRRIDVLEAGAVVQSQVVRGKVAYRCAMPDGGRPGDPLDCTRTSGALPALGGFSATALEAFTDGLLASADAFDLSVEERTVADVPATCLVTAPKAGSPLGASGPGAETLCLSREGAQLLVDAGGQRAVASRYRTTVPAGAFDV